MCYDINHPIKIAGLGAGIRVAGIARSIGGADRFAVVSGRSAARIDTLPMDKRGMFGAVWHPQYNPELQQRAGEDLIGIVRLAEGVEIEGPSLAEVQLMNLAMSDEALVRYTGGDVDRLGTVTSTNASVVLPDIFTNERILYSDMIVVEDLPESVAKFGDREFGGSLIYAGRSSRSVVGMLVGLNNGFSIIAPIQPLFDRLGLEFIDSADPGDDSIYGAKLAANLKTARARFAANLENSVKARQKLRDSKRTDGAEQNGHVSIDPDTATEAVDELLPEYGSDGLVA